MGIKHWLGGHNEVYIEHVGGEYTRDGVILVTKADAAEIRRIFDEAFPKEADDLATANKLDEEYQFSTLSMGATVSDRETEEILSEMRDRVKAACDDNAELLKMVPSSELRQAEAEIARLRAKVKRLKRALKGALK